MLKNTNSGTIYYQSEERRVKNEEYSTLMRWVQGSMFKSPPQSPRRREEL